MNIIQKPAAPINYSKGRGGQKPEAIVIHIMEGSLVGTDEWFANPASQVSAHYGIGRAGEIHQYVSEEDNAYHAGSVVPPTLWDFLGKPASINPNAYTIGIEHEGMHDSVWTDAQKKASSDMIRDICARYNIPIDREHIVGHYQIKSTKPNCPAVNKGIIDELIALARGTAPSPVNPKVEQAKTLIEQALTILKSI